MAVILNYLPKHRHLILNAGKKILSEGRTVVNRPIVSFSPTYTKVVKQKNSIAKHLFSKFSNFIKKPKEKIKELTTSITKKTNNKNSFGSKLNPKNWFNKINKKTVTSMEPKKPITETTFFNNVKKRFNIFKHNIKKKKLKYFSTPKQNIGSQVKTFLSKTKKTITDTTKVFCNTLKTNVTEVVEHSKTTKVVESLPIKQKPKQNLLTKTKNLYNKYKETFSKVKTVQKRKDINEEFTNKKTELNPELKEKIKTRIQFFRSKRIDFKKATKKIDNLYNTIIKAPERLTGKSYENDMISLCDSVGHSFDTLKRNPNYVDSLIKTYGNMKHLTSTLSPEEISIASKLEQVFKRFKEIKFSKLETVRG